MKVHKMINKLKKQSRAALAIVVAGAASAPAYAVDTTAITTELTGAGTAVAAIGAAVVLVYLSIKVFKMIRSAF